MAHLLNLSSPPNSRLCITTTHNQNVSRDWISLRHKLTCNGRFSCLFSDNRREEQARKALETALGGKKIEFDRWNEEIRKREEVGGGGDAAGGGGWFGLGGWFGGSNGDHFWQEAQQASLTVLGIIFLYLIIAKGEVMLAVIFNPLLFILRGTRNGLTSITWWFSRKMSWTSLPDFGNTKEEFRNQVSAKDRAVRKWGS